MKSNIINNIPNIIKYSIKSHLLQQQQIIKFTYIYMYNSSILDNICSDLIEKICKLVKRNNWYNTIKLLK